MSESASASIEPAELQRLDALLERFELTPYREIILEQAAPCIAMALDDPPEPRPAIWPQPPVGASLIGGAPDLPPRWSWPVRDGSRAGFFLQLALADVPRTPWNPLPAHGMLYLFCFTDTAAFCDPPGWELLHWDGPLDALKRTLPPPTPLNDEVIENEFFLAPDARALKLRAGTDFPPGSQGDWDFVNALDRIGRNHGDDNVLDRYFEFTGRAAGPEFEADLAKGRGPYHYPVGRLFGHTDRSIRRDLTMHDQGLSERFSDYAWQRAHAAELDAAGAAWRQIFRLESNPAVGYTSPSDAAPVYVMAKDPGPRPWVPSGAVAGLASK
jgi:hypothetical protein